KGVEDTAFYRATRFAALNEVGGDPGAFGTAPEEFHAAAARREAVRPAAMTTLSTHDTKRSEDVRARLAVLSEMPEEFAAAVRDWSRRRGLSEPSLDLLAWQTLVGTWPISAERLRGYLLKAAREAKLRTSWTDRDPAFEEEVAAWPERVLGDERLAADVARFVDRVRRPGWSNALGQKLLQLTMPGVPDVYQGTELWDLSLVDPDNRRAVDFTARDVLLERLESGRRPPVDATGEAKIHVVRQALHLRRRADLPGYLPLPAAGPAARHAAAFARGPRWGRWPSGSRSAGRRRAAGGAPSSRCPGAAAPGATCSPAAPSRPARPARGPRPAWATCSPATRWPSWSANPARAAGTRADPRAPHRPAGSALVGDGGVLAGGQQPAAALLGHDEQRGAHLGPLGGPERLADLDRGHVGPDEQHVLHFEGDGRTAHP